MMKEATPRKKKDIMVNSGEGIMQSLQPLAEHTLWKKTLKLPV